MADDALPNDVIIGLDLGQAHDYTAIVLAEQIPWSVTDPDPYRYVIRQMKRDRPDRYHKVVGMVADMLPALRAPVTVFDGLGRPGRYQRTVTLAIDRTGVGRAVGDLFLDAGLDCQIVLISITSGREVNRDGFEVTVPKRDLCDQVRILLDTRRLEIVPDSPYTQTLTDELKNFRYTIGKTGHISYGAGEDWRQRNHDDLVLAAALALWQGEQGGGRFQAVPSDMARQLAEMGLA